MGTTFSDNATVKWCWMTKSKARTHCNMIRMTLLSSKRQRWSEVYSVVYIIVQFVGTLLLKSFWEVENLFLDIYDYKNPYCWLLTYIYIYTYIYISIYHSYNPPWFDTSASGSWAKGDYLAPSQQRTMAPSSGGWPPISPGFRHRWWKKTYLCYIWWYLSYHHRILSIYIYIHTHINVYYHDVSLFEFPRLADCRCYVTGVDLLEASRPCCHRAGLLWCWKVKNPCDDRHMILIYSNHMHIILNILLQYYL